MYEGHITGRIVRTSGGKLPYKVVLTHSTRPTTEHGFTTMREAEAFIRRNLPTAGPALSTLYDRQAGES